MRSFSAVFLLCVFVGNVIIGFKSSHRRYSIRKGVLRNFTKFTGKHLCESLFFEYQVFMRILYQNDKRLSFNDLLELDNSAAIH